MSEPTSILTYYDLILRVAELAGVAYYGSDGAQRAIIPIDDVNTFDKCKRIVNDGIRMFIAGAPPEGWSWKNRIQSLTLGSVETTGTVDSGTSTTLVDATLSSTYDADDDVNGYYVYDITQSIYAVITDYTTATGTVTVAAWLDYDDASSSLTPAASDSFAITDVKTVAGDKSRYWLDQDFGRVAGEITWGRNTAGGHITWAHETEIRHRQEVTQQKGDPKLAAVRRYRKQRRWELILDPSPIATDTLQFPYEVGFDQLKMEGGIGNAGAATTLTDADHAALFADDYFNGWTITLIDGTGKYSYATVTDYATATGIFTVADWLSRDGSAGGTDPSGAVAYYVEPAYNKHPAGLLFDDAILSACKAQVEMQYEDVQAGYVQKFYNKDLPDAIAADRRTRAGKLGKMTCGRRISTGRNYYDHTHLDIDGSSK